MKALVAYYSRTGNTKKMAQAIAAGIKKAGLEVDLKEVKDIKPSYFLKYQAIILGSPTYYGQMAAPLKDLIDKTVQYHGRLSGRIGGAFTSSGGVACGSETTILSIVETLLIHGMIIGGDSDLYHYGPVSIGAPNKKILGFCKRYGTRIGQLTKRVFP
jgi:NAD(P)H dehydrogenase (quinone)